MQTLFGCISRRRKKKMCKKENPSGVRTWQHHHAGLDYGASSVTRYRNRVVLNCVFVRTWADTFFGTQLHQDTFVFFVYSCFMQLGPLCRRRSRRFWSWQRISINFTESSIYPLTLGDSARQRSVRYRLGGGSESSSQLSQVDHPLALH